MKLELRPVEGRRAFEEILLQLEEAIDNGHLAAGDRLPSERELAERFQVSRTSVREAIRVLEALGIVRVRRGAEHGAVLRAVPGNAFTSLLRFHLALRHVSLESIIEFRAVVQSWAAAEMALKQDAETLRELGARVAQTEELVDQVTFYTRDVEFHLAMVRATGNEIATAIMEATSHATRRTLLDALARAKNWPTLRSELAREHRAIFDAIVRANDAEAAALVSQHIHNFYSAYAHTTS